MHVLVMHVLVMDVLVMHLLVMYVLVMHVLVMHDDTCTDACVCYRIHDTYNTCTCIYYKTPAPYKGIAFHRGYLVIASWLLSDFISYHLAVLACHFHIWCDMFLLLGHCLSHQQGSPHQ